MADTPKKSNITQEYNVASAGLNLDNAQNSIKKGTLSYALNAALENFDANSVHYQNEPGNEACFSFPDGYKLVGKHFIPEQDKILFFITNPTTGDSEIGFMVNNDCIYKTLVNAVCLNFSVDHPILRMVHKVTNFGTEVYWPDNNGRRYLDIDNIPYIPLSSSEVCDPKDSLALDCNKLSLQPEINIPFLSADDVISGGEITTGTYQFTAQYSDAVGNPYTSYYGVTNPTAVSNPDETTVNFNTPVGKSVIVNIQNLNPSGQYQYFNLAVIKTVNGISTPELVGTYFIDDIYKKITYTGQIKTNIILSMNDIFEKFTYYDNADYVTAVQDVLVWKGMRAVERLSYQKIANGINLKWQSYRIPASEDYSTGANSSNLRGYLRDEVYALGLVLLLTNGKETDEFHIPSRIKGQLEIASAPIHKEDPDFIGTVDEGTNTTPYWKVYNTASVESTDPGYLPEDDNYKGPYQTGEFAYWESSETYPCDEEIWGELANQPIRHHKFPDVLVSPIIESSVNSSEGLQMEDVAIYPIGIKIDSNAVKILIDRSELTQEQKDDIVGYKIVRADRGVNKSVIAKGMLRNVGKYTKDDQTFLYPNYPYNDLNPDPFLNTINNAWTALCEEFTIEIFNLPKQTDGKNWVEVEYVSCQNNKKDTRKFTSTGTYTHCSITRPAFTSRGVHNKMKHSHSGSTPQADCDAISYPSNYDVWRIGWRVNQASGYRAEWNDMVAGIQTHWLCCPFTGGGPTLKVNLPVGVFPTCISGCEKEWPDKGKKKPEYTLLDEVRVEACGEVDTPIEFDQSEDLSTRQIFNSPETSFGQPFLGNILKLETVMYGAGKAHFVEVKDNAKYKLLTSEAQRDALLAAETVADKTEDFSLEAMFSVYDSYVTTYINGITRKNYAYSFNSIASYNYTEAVPNNHGIKQRNIDIKKYITPDVLSVGEEDGVILNNYNRETSVYLRTTNTLPYPHESVNMLTTGVEENSRFTISDKGNCSKPGKEEPIEVVSYYGSLKNEFINQYGQINSYDSVDTGFMRLFDNLGLSDDIIFGGDTFIGKFAYKTKVPFFFDNRVNAPDDSDIFYDEIGNIAYPKYWHSSRSILETYQGVKESMTLTNFISHKAHSFDCPNDQTLVPEDADPDTNPDRSFYDGYYYLFAYGVPSFYCESSYNLDLRTAFNNKEGEFWPHVSTGIPDEWLQETSVSILNDNTYNYNTTFSKQNRETLITHLPADWGTGEERIQYPFRAVYSDKQITDADNRVNNWLTYRPISYFDFPQNYGGLTALDGLKNSAILARFENKSLLYNKLLTMDTSNPQAVYVGNPNLFSNPPIDFAETDQGYVGAQNKMLLKTPYGAISADAKRGQLFLINGSDLQDLTVFGSGMHRWFTAHLPFEIIKYFPNIDTDNNFNGIGLHGVFDSNYERAIITKIDYIPLYDTITSINGKYFIMDSEILKEIFLSDSDYFCNVSWTISFNFNTSSWISFHSYIPNWYVGENNFFYSGLNNCPNDFDMLVGILDVNPPTTTTTTTLPLTTTTTTSMTPYEPDCDFDAILEVPLCTIEGIGVYVGEPVAPGCTRPSGLEPNTKLFSGYELVTPLSTVISTGSSDDACSNLAYYNIYGEFDENYIPTVIYTDAEGYQVGDAFFTMKTAPDCSTIPDGWYFSGETAADNTVFEVITGVITQVIVCGVENTTTTTTTTTLNNYAICYTGLYTDPDAANPLGGIVEYIDEFGVYQVVGSIWDTDIINLTVSSIISTVGVVICP